jgi:uncharacterized protein
VTVARGIEIREAHFPGTLGNRRVRQWRIPFRRHVASRLDPLPAFWGSMAGMRDQDGRLSTALFDRVFAESGDIEFLLVGTGMSIRPLPTDLKSALRAANVSSDPMSTGAAVRTFNVMLAESRAVAAALIAV